MAITIKCNRCGVEVTGDNVTTALALDAEHERLSHPKAEQPREGDEQ